MRKRRLTSEEYTAAIQAISVGPQTREIARGVLVDGKPQMFFVKTLSLSRGAVSQAVKRVWEAHQENNLPQGYERVTAVLPQHQAYQVRQWEAKAKRRMEDP